MFKKALCLAIGLLITDQINCIDYEISLDQDAATAYVVQVFNSFGYEYPQIDNILMVQNLLGFNETGYDLYGQKLEFKPEQIEQAVSLIVSSQNELYQSNLVPVEPSSSRSNPEVSTTASAGAGSGATNQTDKLSRDDAIIFIHNWLKYNLPANIQRKYEKSSEIEDVVKRVSTNLVLDNDHMKTSVRSLELALKEAINHFENKYWQGLDIDLNAKIDSSSAYARALDYLDSKIFKASFPDINSDEINLDEILIRSSVPDKPDTYYKNKLIYLIEEKAKALTSAKKSNGQTYFCSQCKNIVCSECYEQMHAKNCPMNCNSPTAQNKQYLNKLSETDEPISSTCPICQEDVERPVKAPAKTASNNSHNSIDPVCPECTYINTPDKTSCEICGTNLETTTPDTSAAVKAFDLTFAAPTGSLTERLLRK